jgi:hypothetical protein
MLIYQLMISLCNHSRCCVGGARRSFPEPTVSLYSPCRRVDKRCCMYSDWRIGRAVFSDSDGESVLLGLILWKDGKES